MNDFRKHKNKLIAGIISVIILALTLFVTNFFNSRPTTPITHPSDKLNKVANSPTTTNISKDSSHLISTQVTQTNSNIGDVNNEFVSGNKVVNQKTVVIKQDKKPIKRSPSKNDIKRITSIPADYLIELNYSYTNNECQNYGELLTQKLKELGYNYQTSIYGQLSTNTYDPRFEIRIDDANRKAEIIVHVLREN